VQRAIAAAEKAPPPRQPVVLPSFLQRREAQPSRQDAPPPAVPTITHAPPAVRRVAGDSQGDDFDEEYEEYTDISHSSGGSNGNGRNHQTAPEPDIDQIARQVYSQLKRRLAIEWERTQGKQ
jgi:hypothetical protein